MESLAGFGPSSPVLTRIGVQPSPTRPCRRQTDQVSALLATGNIGSMGAVGSRTWLPLGVHELPTGQHRRPQHKIVRTRWRIRFVRRGGRFVRQVCRQIRPSRPEGRRILQHILFGNQKGRGHEAHSQPQTVQQAFGTSQVQDGDPEPVDLHRGPWGLDGILRPQGRVPARANCERALEVPAFRSARSSLAVHRYSLRSLSSSHAVHQGGSSVDHVAENAGRAPSRVLGRHSDSRRLSPAGSAESPDDDTGLHAGWLHHQRQEVRLGPNTRSHLHRGSFRHETGPSVPACRPKARASRCFPFIRARGGVSSSEAVASSPRPHGGNNFVCRTRPLEDATDSVVPEVPVAGQGHDSTDPRHSPGLHVSPVVDGSRQSLARETLPRASTHGDSYHGLVHARVGRSRETARRDQTCSRQLVFRGDEDTTHQRSRAPCSSSHTLSSSTMAPRQSGASRVRQHDSCVLPEQNGGHQVSHAVPRGNAPTRVGSSAWCDCACSPSSRCRQCSGRLSVQEPPGPHRVVPLQSGVFKAVQALGHPSGRSVRFAAEPQTTRVVQQTQLSGGHSSGRLPTELAGVESLRLSPHQSDPENTPTDQRSAGGRRHCSGSPLAGEGVVLSPPANGLDNTREIPPGDRSPLPASPGQGEALSPRPQLAVLDSLEAERQVWRDQGFSEAAIDTALAALQASSRTVYDARWRGYVQWCTEGGINPLRATLGEVVNFLQHLADIPRALDTIKGYVTVLSRRLSHFQEGQSRLELSKTEAVQAWLRGAKVKLQKPPKIIPQWDLEVVLSALKKHPFFARNLSTLSLKNLTLRTVFLLALTSARRASELHALDISCIHWNPSGVEVFVNKNFKPKCHSGWHRSQPIVLPATASHEDPELRKLCVSSTLRAYLKCTEPLRKTSQLFVCYGDGTRGNGVSKQRISTWLKEMVEQAYKAKNLPPPGAGKVKGHDVRKMATSWAEVAGVDPKLICKAATWKTESTFARFYRLNLFHDSRSEFGRSILGLAASAAAERALQSSLAPSARPTRGRRKRST